MPDPFVIPEETSAAAAIAAIKEDFELLDDWNDRYAYMIERATKLPDFPLQWRDDEHRVLGCVSSVWMESRVLDGQVFFAGASDGKISNGMVALLLRVYSGRTPAEVLATSPDFLKDLGLLANLTAGRGNGIGSMAARIRKIAQACAAE